MVRITKQIKKRNRAAMLCVVVGGMLGGPWASPATASAVTNGPLTVSTFVEDWDSGEIVFEGVVRLDLVSATIEEVDVDEIEEFSYSADGTQIAWSTFDNRIYVANEDFSGIRSLTRGESPSWSPSGHRLVYARGGDLWTIRNDGTDRRAVTDTDKRESRPDWGPDGRRIAFAARGRWCCINTIRPGGSGRKIVKGPMRYQGLRFYYDYYLAPEWSPDGRKLLFTGMYDSGDGDWQFPYFGAFKMNSDGTRVRQVGRVQVYVDSSTRAVWSPDGRHVAWLVSDDVEDGGRVYVMRRDGSERRRVFPADDDTFAYMFDLDWQPVIVE